MHNHNHNYAGVLLCGNGLRGVCAGPSQCISVLALQDATDCPLRANIQGAGHDAMLLTSMHITTLLLSRYTHAKHGMAWHGVAYRKGAIHER